MSEKERTVCFSGHRKFNEPRAEVEKRIEYAVRECIANGSEVFIAGGAIGVDTLAAQTVIRLRKEYPQIRLVLALPCPPEDQTLKWSADQKAEYQSILGQANEVKILSDKYTDSCMLDRNRFMVDNSSKLIYYLRKDRSGTGYTVRYAKKQTIKLIAI